MDNPKIVSIMRFLLLIVQHDNCLTVDDAAKCLHINRRTVYRYINTLNDVGFELTKSPISLKWDCYAMKQLLKIKDASFMSHQRVYLDILSAIHRKRKASFDKYSSGHSGQCAYYKVEPYKMSEDGQFVYAYDESDPTDQRCKVFKLARIDRVNVLDGAWEHSDCHKEMKTDAFNMSGETTFKVKLRLNMQAYCLLLEEYPRAASHPLCTLEPDGDTYILTAQVCSMKGIGRFYLGLIDCITLLEGPELNAYLRTILQDNLPGISFK